LRRPPGEAPKAFQHGRARGVEVEIRQQDDVAMAVAVDGRMVGHSGASEVVGADADHSE
jgi:hypothetical protein